MLGEQRCQRRAESPGSTITPALEDEPLLVAVRRELTTHHGAGVLIGALSTAIVQAYFEQRRERGDLRQAKRLVAGELVRVAIHFNGLVEGGRAPTTLGGESRFLPDAMWREYRATLARYLADDAYDLLSLVMESLPTTRDLLADIPSGQPLPDDLRESVETARSLSFNCYELITGKDLDLPASTSDGDSAKRGDK